MQQCIAILYEMIVEEWNIAMVYNIGCFKWVIFRISKVLIAYGFIWTICEIKVYILNDIWKSMLLPSLLHFSKNYYKKYSNSSKLISR